MSAQRSPTISGKEPNDKIKEVKSEILAEDIDQTLEAKEIHQTNEDESEEESINEQFGRLHKYLERARIANKPNIWGVVELIKSFTTASAYPLSELEKEYLLEDMKATAVMLEAAETLINASDEDGNVSPAIRSDFTTKLTTVLDYAGEEQHNNYEKARDIFIKIGVALSMVAFGAAAGVLAAGAAPLIAIGFLVAGIILCAASVIAHYRQSNCTFFGQSQQNHMLMADLVATESSILEPKTVGCCR